MGTNQCHAAEAVGRKPSGQGRRRALLVHTRWAARHAWCLQGGSCGACRRLPPGGHRAGTPRKLWQLARKGRVKEDRMRGDAAQIEGGGSRGARVAVPRGVGKTASLMVHREACAWRQAGRRMPVGQGRGGGKGALGCVQQGRGRLAPEAVLLVRNKSQGSNNTSYQHHAQACRKTHRQSRLKQSQCKRKAGARSAEWPRPAGQGKGRHRGAPACLNALQAGREALGWAAGLWQVHRAVRRNREGLGGNAIDGEVSLRQDEEERSEAAAGQLGQ